MPPQVVLVRHGETEWSVERRHTGRTDIPLSDEGRRRAAALGPLLRLIPGIDTAVVATSPRQRARDTAARAGFGDRAEVWPELAEWDYGVYEGRRTSEIRESIPDWSVWTHPIEEGEGLTDVAARVDRVIERLMTSDRTVVLFAHAHVLRILGVRWCGLDPSAGRALTLDPGGTSLLGWEHDYRVIERWNLSPDLARVEPTPGEEPLPSFR
jgi:broad specificity phosphatase PhoE